MTCPGCDGTGVNHFDEDGVMVKERCEDCNGSGVREQAERHSSPSLLSDPETEWSRTDQRMEDTERETEEYYERLEER